MGIKKLNMQFDEGDILTVNQLNEIENKIEEITLIIKTLYEDKIELLYDNEEVKYDNEIVYAIIEEE